MNAESHESGIHFYMSLLTCPRRTTRCHEEDGGADADFGTAVHHYLNWFHGPRLSEAPALNAEKPLRTCSEAQLCDRYARRFAPAALGVELLAERRLTMVTEDGLPFAGTLDRVASLDAACCEALRLTTGVTLTPGIYLIDYKTKKANMSTLIASMRLSPQFTGYAELWRAHYPDQLLEGILVLILFRYTEEKPEQFQLLHVPMPDEAAIAVWRGIIRDASAHVAAHGAEWCNPTHCFDWGRACPGLSDCDRTNALELPRG